jgi:uncharacterized protein (TIGR02300 family)
VAKQQLGTKRICPETGKKFYDLGRDPVVSPYTGASYPLSAFDLTKKIVRSRRRAEERPKKTTTPKPSTAKTLAMSKLYRWKKSEPKGTLDDDDDDDDDDNADDVIPDIDTTDIDDDDR